MQKEPLVLRICDFVTKYSVYALVFLTPLFFLPQTAEVLDFNKQALLVLLVFISVFALLLKTLISGKFEINKSFFHVIAGVLFLAYLLSTIFSVYRYGSFWGQPQQISESALTVICLLLFYFVFSNFFSKKDILISAIVLSLSAVIAELVGVFQIFGLFILPFDFAKSSAFNTLGSFGGLGFFVAILFPLAMMLLIIVKKWWRFFFALQIVLSALLLILINYPIIWWVAIIGSALILLLGIIKNDLFDGRWQALPMFFLVVSLFFVIFNPQINWLPHPQSEILLSQKSGLDIATRALKANPILGSGPGTFAYDFSKFKNPDFSKTSLWNTAFGKSSSKVLNSAATTGALGFLALLAFMIFPIFYGIKFFIRREENNNGPEAEKSPSQIYSILLIGLSVALIQQIIACFVYNSNIVLDFVFFFIIAASMGLVSERKQKYVLKQSSAITLGVTFVFTLFFIFGIGLLFLGGQRYVAEASYYKGLVAYQAGKNADGLKKLETAVSLNSKSDLYFRQLSQAYLINLQQELQNAGSASISDQQKTKIQTLVSNSINAAKIATDINPNDVNNWSSRGYVYQSLSNLLSDAETWAISSYDSALKLDPSNPYLFFQEGSVYLAGVSAQGISADQKSQLLLKAQKQLEKAVALTPSYSNALYSLGIVYDLLGQNGKAIDAFTKLQQLNPANTDIPKILANLKAGKSIFQTATPPAETPSGAVNKK
ncbi:MAG: hypothetical protein NT155_03260 [Candidatus Staskawiczbacteria bacterium]|nr:hypothetical protein [Candidatus Staskawiczbacteria bacterium]